MGKESPHDHISRFALLGGDGVVQAGQSEQIGLTADGGVLRTVTLINGECPTELATYVTIFLTLTRYIPAAPPGQENETLPLIARCSFGNGGTQSTQQLEVDYINGSCFAVPPGFLRVDAILDVDPGEEVAIGMNAGAFVGYGVHTRKRSPQLTRRLGIIAPASAAVVAVPFFADDLELHSAVPGTTYTVDQYADAALTTLLSSTAYPAAGERIRVGLVNGARYINVTNTGGAPAATRAVFGLVV